VLGKQIEHQLFEQTAAAFAQSLSLLLERRSEWASLGWNNRMEILSRHSGHAEKAWGRIISKLLDSK
jgi:hypothetical protein